MFASETRKRRIEGTKSSRWRRRLDEMIVKINGERHQLWRAVDHEGEVLDSFVTDLLRSYRAALKATGVAGSQETGRWLNNRAGNSHLKFRRRERAVLSFRRTRSLQKCAAVHALIYNFFNSERSLYTRPDFKLNRAVALDE